MSLISCIDTDKVREVADKKFNETLLYLNNPELNTVVRVLIYLKDRIWRRPKN